MSTTPFDDLGQRLIALGEALRNGSTTVSQLAELSHACGLRLKVRLADDSNQIRLSPVFAPSPAPAEGTTSCI